MENLALQNKKKKKKKKRHASVSGYEEEGVLWSALKKTDVLLSLLF